VLPHLFSLWQHNIGRDGTLDEGAACGTWNLRRFKASVVLYNYMVHARNNMKQHPEERLIGVAPLGAAWMGPGCVPSAKSLFSEAVQRDIWHSKGMSGVSGVSNWESPGVALHYFLEPEVSQSDLDQFRATI
jgi:hypothetical protein